MRFELDRITIHNFKCFTGNRVVVSFDQMPIGLHLIQGRNDVTPSLGSNGSGKSSLWDALSFCLYGRGTEDLRGTDCRPWYSDERTVIDLVLTLGKTKYMLRRGLGPSVLLLDGKTISQEYLDEMLGLNLNAFRHTVLLGQGQPLFFDLTPSEKMRLFTDVLQLDRWDGYVAKATAAAAEQEQLRAGVEMDLARCEGKREGLVKAAKAATAQAAEWELNAAARQVE